jgi:UDP-N-acetylglucosamine 2-epimerase
MLKIVTIIGARPQFIKAATVSRAILQHNKKQNNRKIREVIIHTGQHYDEGMSKVFFEELQIPEPDYNLGIGSGSHGRQTGRMLEKIEEALTRERPDLVLIYGDTNSTLAGALAAVKLHIPAAHVEAGLRSFNRRMPEEINRVVTDHVSNPLFCPTETAVNNLKSEGITNNPPAASGNLPIVVNAGDVMFDSLLFNMKLAETRSTVLAKLGIADRQKTAEEGYHRNEIKQYFLATIHRPENTDDQARLESILGALKRIVDEGIRIIFPLHPRTRKCIEKADLAEQYQMKGAGEVNVQDGRIAFIDPVGYLDMIQLEKHARAIITDSGGIQKEAFLMKVPCITLRNQTEWAETVEAGWNRLTGSDSSEIWNAYSKLLGWEGPNAPFETEDFRKKDEAHQAHTERPYGDGRAAEKIIEICLKTFPG